jgi:hypothetical protein
MLSARVAVVAMAMGLLSGCGTIMHGTRQNIDVQSSPTGAKVETSPATAVFTTPATLNLERKNSYVLTFTSAGYAPASVNIHNNIGTGTIIADVLLGLVGVLVDGITGAWYGLEPESVNVTLARLSGTGPETIHIQVGVSDGGGLKVSSDAPNVRVEVTRQ